MSIHNSPEIQKTIDRLKKELTETGIYLGFFSPADLPALIALMNDEYIGDYDRRIPGDFELLARRIAEFKKEEKPGG